MPNSSRRAFSVSHHGVSVAVIHTSVPLVRFLCNYGYKRVCSRLTWITYQKAEGSKQKAVTVHCLLLTAFCLLPSAYCLLLTAFCLLCMPPDSGRRDRRSYLSGRGWRCWRGGRCRRS